MTKQQQAAYLKELEDKLLTAEDRALWKRGASNQAYHYFGSAKILGQIGKAFAEAMLTMEASEANLPGRYEQRSVL